MKQNTKTLCNRALVSILCFGMIGTNMNISGLAAQSDAVMIGDTGYDTLAEAVEAAAAEDTLVICGDLDVTEPVVVDKKITLTAQSPATLTKAATNPTLDKGCVFSVQAGGELTLDGALTVQGSEQGASLIRVSSVNAAAPAVLNMEDGVTLTGNTVTASGTAAEGGAVTVSGNAVFNMNGGTISDCGNAASRSDANLTIYGAGLGGAVAVDGSAGNYETTFNMNGGEITRCFAQYGGAVGVYTRNAGNAVVNMNDGVITGNCASTSYSTEVSANMGEGAAMFVCAYTDNNSIDVNIKGGSITGNVAQKMGLGMNTRVSDRNLGGHYNIIGGTIAGNKAGTSSDQSAYNAWGKGVFAGRSGLVTVGGDAQIADEVYIKDCTINVLTDFTGTANIYVPDAAQDDPVAVVVDENGEPAAAEANVRGELKLIDRTSDGETLRDGIFLIIPDGNGFQLNALNPATIALLRVIEMAKGAVQGDYTTASWEALQEAIAEAKRVVSSADATRAEADAAMRKLLKAYNDLQPIADRTSLQTAIEAATEFMAAANGNDYEHYQDLRKAYDYAVLLMSKEDATPEEVNAAAVALLEQLHRMVKKADLTSLESLVEAAADLLDGSYTEDSLEALRAALEAAQAVLDNLDRTDEEISNAYTALIDAVLGLVRAGNKASLESMLEKANAMLAEADRYTPSTIAGLPAVRDAAQAVYDDASADQDTINAATRDLTLEISKARLKGDVNGDGRISSTDAARLLKASAELIELDDTEKASGDVNGDGAADTSDVSLILQFAAERITEF